MSGGVAVVLIALGAAAWYGRSIWRHPYRACRHCHGGDHQDKTWKGTYGRCHYCKGKGDVMRLGVRLLMPATAKAIRGGQKGKNF